MDEVSERRFADPYVAADLDELDAPLGDQAVDESRGTCSVVRPLPPRSAALSQLDLVGSSCGPPVCRKFVLGSSSARLFQCGLPLDAVSDDMQQPLAGGHAVRVARLDRLPAVPARVGCQKSEHAREPGLAVGAMVSQRLARPLARDQDAAPGVAEVFAAVGLALAATRDQAWSGVLGSDAVAHAAPLAGPAAPAGLQHTWRVTAELGGDFAVDADDSKSTWAVAAVAAGFTAGGVAMIIWAGLIGLVVGLLTVVFFGVICLPYIVFRAVRLRPSHDRRHRKDPALAHALATPWTPSTASPALMLTGPTPRASMSGNQGPLNWPKNEASSASSHAREPPNQTASGPPRKRINLPRNTTWPVNSRAIPRAKIVRMRIAMSSLVVWLACRFF